MTAREVTDVALQCLCSRSDGTATIKPQILPRDLQNPFRLKQLPFNLYNKVEVISELP